MRIKYYPLVIAFASWIQLCQIARLWDLLLFFSERLTIFFSARLWEAIDQLCIGKRVSQFVLGIPELIRGNGSYLLYHCYRWRESELWELNFVLQSEAKVNTRSLKAEYLLQEIIKSNGFLAATRINNENKILSSGHRVCVVDPALSDCQTMGFAALLLRTIDDILLCEALGSDRPVVYWKACKSVCSRDPRVNSWEWYFEPIGSGLLESQAERVLCPLMLENEESVLRTLSNLKLTLNSSFRNRSYTAGFANNRIITEKERRRVNQMLQQYIKPNNRIIRKLNNFYQRYLAGNTVLGVHVRGTDHWMETNEKRLPHLMSWIKSAQSILKTLPQPSKIFIASDNDEVIEKFVAVLGNDKVSSLHIALSFQLCIFHTLRCLRRR